MARAVRTPEEIEAQALARAENRLTEEWIEQAEIQRLERVAERETRGSIYQKPTNYTPWIIGGVAIVLGGTAYAYRKEIKKAF